MNKIDKSKKAIEERRKIARDAEILAGLDNNTPLSKEFIAVRNKWIKGEISDKEYKDAVLSNKKEYRKHIARDAEILASLDNDTKHSLYAKELQKKWINGEISSIKELKLLIKHHKK